MPLITAIPFYAAAVAYCLAAVFTIVYTRNGIAENLDRSRHAGALGNVLLLLVFLYRWAHYGLVPFTGLGDSLNLLIVMCVGIIMVVQRDRTMKPVMMFYMPAVAIIAILNAVFSPASLAEPPMALNGVILSIHVILVFLAFASFLVASVTSMAYVVKAQSLKRIKTGPVSHRLPSLERMDRTLYRLIGYGYPIFAVTLILGFLWAYQQRGELGPGWYMSPRIVLALVMVLFYAGSFHVRQGGLLRGPKLAYLVFGMSLLLFLSYLGIELAQIGGYTFGGGPS